MLEHFTMQEAAETLKAGDLKRAEQMFKAAAGQNPDDWFPWFNLASIEGQRNNTVTAMAFLYRALSLNPDETAILNNLGTLLRMEHHVDKAKEVFLEGAQRKPDDPDLWSNLSTLYVNEGNPELGLEYAEKALALKPDHVNAGWNRALLLLECGRLEEGFEAYAAGVHTGERMERWRSIPYYNPETDQDKVVLTYGEQGLGDEIMYLSVLDYLVNNSGSVIYECHPRLESLVKRSFPYVTVYPTRKDIVLDWEEPFDVKIPIGDLPKYWRRKPADFPRKPYLVVDPAIEAQMRARLQQRAGDGPYVGIAWKGGYKKTRKDLRSMPLEDLLPVIRAAHESGAKLVSFQYTKDAEMEVRQFERKHGIRIHHWPDVICGNTDYMLTAGLLANMYQTIAVNTSLVHLAGALGCPLWTMTPKGCAWRYWSPDNKMLWYDSVIQYRAGENKTWAPVIERLANDLREKLK